MWTSRINKIIGRVGQNSNCHFFAIFLQKSNQLSNEAYPVKNKLFAHLICVVQSYIGSSNSSIFS